MSLFDFFTKKKQYDYEYVVLDTETTGLENDDEIVEIAIVSNTGEVLLNTLVKPKSPMSVNCYAVNIHGITNEMLENAPQWHEIYPQFKDIVKNNKVIIYNEKFDRRLIEQTCSKYGLKSPLKQTHCAMLEYGEWFGEWDYARNQYRWHKLEQAIFHLSIEFKGEKHRALSDCLATLEIYKIIQSQTRQAFIHALQEKVAEQKALLEEKYNENQIIIKEQVRHLLNAPDLVVLNINGRIKTSLALEVTIVDMQGNILLDTFIQPVKKIGKTPKYLQQLDMTVKDFEQFPKWTDVYQQIQAICHNKKIISAVRMGEAKDILTTENQKNGLPEPDFHWLIIQFEVSKNSPYKNVNWETIAGIAGWRDGWDNKAIYRSSYNCFKLLAALNYCAEYGMPRWLYGIDDESTIMVEI